jgi:hypothetical protein
MLRPLVSLLVLGLIPLASYGARCHSKITRSEAIRIAKRGFAVEHGRAAAAWYAPWVAQFHDCIWSVIGRTPPQSLSGDAHVDVAADSGRAIVQPIMRTDPSKVRHLKQRHASNQAVELTSTRRALTFSHD